MESQPRKRSMVSRRARGTFDRGGAVHTWDCRQNDAETGRSGAVLQEDAFTAGLGGSAVNPQENADSRQSSTGAREGSDAWRTARGKRPHIGFSGRDKEPGPECLWVATPVSGEAQFLRMVCVRGIARDTPHETNAGNCGEPRLYGRA